MVKINKKCLHLSTLAVTITLIANCIAFSQAKYDQHKQNEIQKNCNYTMNDKNIVFEYSGSSDIHHIDDPKHQYQMCLNDHQVRNRNYNINPYHTNDSKAYCFDKKDKPLTRIAQQKQLVNLHALPIATVGNKGCEYSIKGQPLREKSFNKNAVFTLKDKLRKASDKNRQYHQYLDCVSSIFPRHNSDKVNIRYHNLYVPMVHLNNHYFYRLQDGNLLLTNDVALIDKQKLVGVNVPCSYKSSFADFKKDYIQAENYERKYGKIIINSPDGFHNNSPEGANYDFENNYSFFHSWLNGWYDYIKMSNLRPFRKGCYNKTLGSNTKFVLTNATSFDNAIATSIITINEESQRQMESLPLSPKTYQPNKDLDYGSMQDTIYGYDDSKHGAINNQRVPGVHNDDLFYLTLEIRRKNQRQNHFCYFPYDLKHITNSKYLKLDSSMRHKLISSAPNEYQFEWIDVIKPYLNLCKKSNPIKYLYLRWIRKKQLNHHDIHTNLNYKPKTIK